MKNYATETDIITTPDPVFYYGDRVTLDPHRYALGNGLFSLYVQSWSWDTLVKSWVYTLVYFTIAQDGLTLVNDGSMAHQDVLEQDMVLLHRELKHAQPKIVGKYAIVNGKEFIF